MAWQPPATPPLCPAQPLAHSQRKQRALGAAAPRRPRCGQPWRRWCSGTSTRALWCWPGAGPAPPGTRGCRERLRALVPETPPRTLGEESALCSERMGARGESGRGRVGGALGPVPAAALETREPYGLGQQWAASKITRCFCRKSLWALPAPLLPPGVGGAQNLPCGRRAWGQQEA